MPPKKKCKNIFECSPVLTDCQKQACPKEYAASKSYEKMIFGKMNAILKAELDPKKPSYTILDVLEKADPRVMKKIDALLIQQINSAASAKLRKCSVLKCNPQHANMLDAKNKWSCLLDKSAKCPKPVKRPTSALEDVRVNKRMVKTGVKKSKK